jgi:hypothetical protein
VPATYGDPGCYRLRRSRSGDLPDTREIAEPLTFEAPHGILGRRDVVVHGHNRVALLLGRQCVVSGGGHSVGSALRQLWTGPERDMGPEREPGGGAPVGVSWAA